MAECIANEDGERQIACAVSFNGEEIVSVKYYSYNGHKIELDMIQL